MFATTTKRRGQWDRWYNTKPWDRRRKLQLRQQPLCEICLREGRLEPAEIADHVQPHRGDYNLFRLGPLQSLCKKCHDQTKHIVELKGFSNKVDLQGNPIDPNHPWNKDQFPTSIPKTKQSR